MIIDVTRLCARLLDGKFPTGVDRVSLAYVARFRSQADALVRHRGRWIGLSGPASKQVFDALLGEHPRPKWVIRSTVAAAFLTRWALPRGSLLLNTGHSGLDDPDYADRVRRYGFRTVYFLHDLIPLTHPEYCREGEAVKHRQRLDTMIGTGAGLILNSEATSADLAAYADRAHLPLPPHIVATIGTVALPAPLEIVPCESPYFVMLGTIEPRKNHWLVLHLWRQLAERCPSETPTLVVIGQRGWECEQVVDLLERCAALRNKVIEVGACDDRSLAGWLRHARALLFPSFVEGYGMPLAEALGHGVPVIASDLPVFREIAGGIPDYLDPLDGPGWRRLVLDYASPTSAARAAQLKRLREFHPPRWSTHFTRVMSLLNGLTSGT